MYLIVYYALLTESELSDKFAELMEAYEQAHDASIFALGEAYQYGYINKILMNASKQNILKLGSYLFGLYSICYEDASGK